MKQGRVAIVTGGTGALGQAIVRRCLDGGARIWVPWIIEDELTALRGALKAGESDRVRPVRADVTDEASFGEFVRGVLDSERRVDILVNTGGGFA